MSPFKSLWRLQCRCGASHGGLLGHCLQDYNPHYRGDAMVTPIAFKCSDCATTTEILDTNVHGYHAEVAKLEGAGGGSAIITGSGERINHHCRACSNDAFDFIVGFLYWNFDMAVDEPALSAQNFFHEFIMLCTCARCGSAWEPVMLGKL